MTAAEVYESVTHGGASDFADVAAILNRNKPWCLIGGLAVNCYVEPVYTIDVDLVVVAKNLARIQRENMIRGKVWAWQDATRRLSKRKKDELDLLRIAEACPELGRLIPAQIVEQLK